MSRETSSKFVTPRSVGFLETTFNQLVTKTMSFPRSALKSRSTDYPA